MNPMKSITSYSITLILVLCFFVNAQQDIWQQTFGPETGSVTSFARDTSGHIFVGTDESFMFRSDNNGQSWRALDSGGAPDRVECLLIPDGITIYAGIMEIHGLIYPISHLVCSFGGYMHWVQIH